MTVFLNLPLGIKAVCILFSLLSVAIAAVLISFHIDAKKRKIIILLEIIAEVLNALIFLFVIFAVFNKQSVSILPDYLSYVLFGYSYAFAILCLVFAVISIGKDKKSITKASVKHAVEASDFGILISDEKGNPVLSNESMSGTVKCIFGRDIKNSIILKDSIQSFENNAEIKKIKINDNYIFKLGNGKACEFYFSEFNLKGRIYYEILAFDVTETVNASEQTRKNLQAIVDCENSLQWTKENVEGIKKEIGIYSNSCEFHEAAENELQRLSDILSGDKERKEIVEFADKMLSRINDGGNLDQKALFASYKFAFNLLGITLTFIGRVPESDNTVCIFDVLRKLAFSCYEISGSKRITAAIYEGSGKVTLTVTADVSDEINTSFIESLKGEISSLGASIQIETHPTLKAVSVIPLQ